MSASQLLKRAESLKVAVQDTTNGASEAWVSRQALQDLYQKLLVIDLEYALDKKVEQELWNYAFKNQINTLQGQSKDKHNPKRVEVQASLNLFLETASGFYLQLLQELCSAFKLDLPFRRRSANIGIIKEYGPVVNKARSPKRSSCMYICQHCLVHLGDIARYRQQSDQAQSYYRHAAHLVPFNGQPYNQLAILEAAKGNKLATIFYYIRSVAVKHPFPVASTNLEKFYSKLNKDTSRIKMQSKMSMSEVITAFLHFHALIHLDADLEKAQQLSEKLLLNLPTHITSMSFSSHQFVQMIAIDLFALDHSQHHSSEEPSTSAEDANGESPASTDNKAYDLILNMLVMKVELLLLHTPKQETKAKDYHTLPALKLLLDWLLLNPHHLTQTSLHKNSSLWMNLSKLLNNLQFHANQKEFPDQLQKYVAVPLTEDADLQCFLPIIKAHSDLDFNLSPPEGLSPELELRLRCQRIIEQGLSVCEEFPSLNVLNVQKLKSGRLQFSAPSAHIKVVQCSTSTDSDGSTEHKSYRQNVAIQAIMLNKARQTEDIDDSLIEKTDNSPSSKSHHEKHMRRHETPRKSDAGVMAFMDSGSGASDGEPTPGILKPPHLNPANIRQPSLAPGRQSHLPATYTQTNDPGLAKPSHFPVEFPTNDPTASMSLQREMGPKRPGVEEAGVPVSPDRFPHHSVKSAPSNPYGIMGAPSHFSAPFESQQRNPQPQGMPKNLQQFPKTPGHQEELPSFPNVSRPQVSPASADYPPLSSHSTSNNPLLSNLTTPKSVPTVPSSCNPSNAAGLGELEALFAGLAAARGQPVKEMQEGIDLNHLFLTAALIQSQQQSMPVSPSPPGTALGAASPLHQLLSQQALHPPPQSSSPRHPQGSQGSRSQGIGMGSHSNREVQRGTEPQHNTQPQSNTRPTPQAGPPQPYNRPNTGPQFSTQLAQQPYRPNMGPQSMFGPRSSPQTNKTPQQTFRPNASPLGGMQQQQLRLANDSQLNRPQSQNPGSQQQQQFRPNSGPDMNTRAQPALNVSDLFAAVTGDRNNAYPKYTQQGERPSSASQPPSEFINSLLKESPKTATPPGQNTLSPSSYYSLFNHSPWDLTLSTSTQSSGSSAYEGSSRSSLTTTPEPFPRTINPEPRSPEPQYHTDSHNLSRDNNLLWDGRSQPADIGSNGHMAGGMGGQVPMMQPNLQSLWTAGPSGPSPLEKLLQQQRHQRHGDPH